MAEQIKNRGLFRLPGFDKRPVFGFIDRRSGPFDGEVALTRDRVYIIPTRAGLVFAVLLLVLLLGSINYEKSLGFALTFLLAGIANVALLASWRNLAGLRLKAADCSPVYAGEQARFEVQLINQQALPRMAIAISYLGEEHDVIDCAASSVQIIHFTCAADSRGWLKPGKFRLYTEFPTGLFIAWTWIDLNLSCLVYPAPEIDAVAEFYGMDESGERDNHGNGIENFNQLRKYQQGDNISRIFWKAAAKSDELFSKQFNGAARQNQWISWHEIEARDKEHRLSIMTALVIQAHNRQQAFGIKLPDKTITPNQGNKHFHQCLSALALF